MKKILLILLPILCLGSKIAYPENINTGNTSLSGKITDSKTGEPLPGVSVYLPDYKTGTISHSDGTYRIDKLPKTSVLIQVSLIGYKLQAENIDLSVITKKDFVMEMSITELNEVVVTGLSNAGQRNSTPAPISIIPIQQLEQNNSSNIIDAIAKQPDFAGYNWSWNFKTSNQGAWL
ncbi:MAG TPA: carboxypeptidase-like regulatory domain-containing protein [Bacteroidales bacterium]|nr:carboxypeptidase-like regulatory domain-containing protein [Bacteroidales bacterium]